MPDKKRARTDRHNNPTAFTTAVAKAGKLIEGVDYEKGDGFPPFPVAPGAPKVVELFTARILGDPLEVTIRLIDNATFYTKSGQRWSYIAIPPALWREFSRLQKIRVIQFMYEHEGGTELKHLFPVVEKKV